MLLTTFIGSGTSCPGLPDDHEWVADCDMALEKLNKRMDKDDDE
jgi:hypothetical protein